MATVHMTAPRHDGKSGGGGSSSKKRKRSRSGSSSRALMSPSGTGVGAGGGVSSAEMAAVRATLAGLEKWQLAVNIGA